GSIVWIDGGGALRVGPRSAGASPGPVCYGLGGTEPTLTDACAVLGYLDPQGLAGGEEPLDLPSSRKSLEGNAKQLSMQVGELAHGRYLIGGSNRCRAIRATPNERGT